MTILSSSMITEEAEVQENNVVILHEVNGYTIKDNRLHSFEAMAMRNGKVLELGTRASLAAAYPGVEQISGNGHTLLPGLIDAHAHVMGLGYQEMDVDVSGLLSVEETVDKVAGHARRNPELAWIRGRGWNQVLWIENEFPAAADLDEKIPDRPVWLQRVDSHAGWANSKAMELAGITDDTPDPPGGRVVRDEDGRATGVFIDAAMRYISERIPARTGEERKRALELASQKMASHGITSVHDARIGAEDWELYRCFAGEGRLNTRIYAMIDGTEEGFDRLAAVGPVEGCCGDMLALRSVKLMADGALGSRGAALLEEYDDDPGNKGLLFYDQQKLNRMVQKGVYKGFQINIHAIGDAAVRQVLNAFEKAREELGDRRLRHRIEHAQVVHPDDFSRFTDLDIIASMQPVHATSDMNMAEYRLGSRRMEGAYAWQRFLGQGTRIAAGSDFPVEQANPFHGLHAAVTRQDRDGNPKGGWYPGQAMSRVEALRAFTLDAAYAAHQEEIIGSLEPGKWADYIIINRDFFEMDASEIWQIDVLETRVAGERVYTSN